uniref:Ska2 N-terminal domain-containing protein n=1 Tax=Branchiostoma floridae TaxID=7739 RepID=C3YW64_BRAFL|eukprot:XP_002599506.1 hypothetical protein BRAFLDRAFT_80983 [Branchiostoma floridae]
MLLVDLSADEVKHGKTDEFKKTEDDIERVTSRLEADFALEKSEEQDQAAGLENDVPQEVLVQRLGEVKKEYSSLVREAEEVRKMQEEMSLFFQSQLMEACQMLQQLQTTPGPQHGGISAELFWSFDPDQFLPNRPANVAAPSPISFALLEQPF